jgi:hypothetical protein
MSAIKNIVKKTDDAVESVKKPTFLFTVGLTYISYIFLFLGISYLLPSYIRTITTILHSTICIFLMYKFNPLRSVQEITETDKNLIFFSALFILMSTSITEFSIAFFNSMRQVLKDDMSTSIY